MVSYLLIAVTLQAPVAGAQWPAVSSEGRIAYEDHGDIFMFDRGTVRRITSGSAIDRQPAWMPDGRALVFVSDRAGNADLWRVALNSDGSAGALEQLTRTPELESEPAVAPDGQIVFTRGTVNSDLFIWHNGTEKKLVSAAGPDRSASVANDWVAYSATRDGRRQLRVIRLDGTQDRQVTTDAEYPALSPDGARIAFVSTTGRRPVLITNREGTYTSTVSLRRGRPVWLPRADSLLLSELPADNAGYNGDPDRMGDRDAERDLLFAGAIWRVAAPAAPDAGSALELRSTLPDSSQVQLLERAAQRVTAAYFSKPEQAAARANWEQTARAYRERATRTTTRAELDQLIHEMLQRRPLLRDEAVGRAGVSSAHPLATEAGLEIFRKGGNAVDAAVAVSFALGVVEPDASGMGGYGEMLIHVKGNAEPQLLEFMTRVPEEGGLGNSALADPNLHRAALAMVPGTVDAMHRAWRRFGSQKVKWAELLEPAIRLAEQGFVLDDAFTTTLRRHEQDYARYESTRALFFRHGKPLVAGDTLKNPDLAWTLKQIAQGGADAFYRGEIARRMVTDLRSKGNAISLRDLARYYAEWREPVTTTYRGHTIYSSAPPASGGALLAGQLNLLENAKIGGRPADDVSTAHAMIEAWKLTPRSRIADPSLWPVDISAAVSKDTARARWSCFFKFDRATRPRELDSAATRCPGTASESLHEDGTGTTSFTVADADGNLVAVTQTLGTWGGNFYVTPGLGFIYNDKLNSYGTAPDAFGARLPFARVGSTLAPTLVFRGTGADRKPLLAVGAAGNAWINSAVYNMVTGVIDHGLGPQQVLELPRFLPGTQQIDDRAETVISIESGFSPAVLQKLEQMGHRFNVISLPGELRMGYGAAVMISNGKVRAGGDPRRSGTGGTIQ